MERNLFVLGIDDFNLRQLRAIRNADNYRFHPLMTVDEVKAHGTFPFQSVLDQARDQLARFDGRIDAIIGYWDFPVTSAVAVLCREFGLPSPTVESVACCEHKYWGRLEQQRLVPEMVPRFAAVDPFEAKAADQLDLDFPFWLKPIKSTNSLLSFRVHDRRELEDALSQIREGIGPIAEAFDAFLSQVSLPSAIAPISGRYCIAEAPLKGRQCTVSGYVYRGKANIYGVVDSINYPNGMSFQRYQYPSRLPNRVKTRMREASVRVMEGIGYDQAAFNIEYFYDEGTDALSLLEVNPRFSQSHGYLYRQVDGRPNHQVGVELALGEEPCVLRRQGPFGCAAKFHLRAFEDALVEQVPSEAALRQIEQDYPGSCIDLLIKPGMRLSELFEQDSYSYELAHIFIAAHDQHELLGQYEQIVDAMPLKLS
ncbi:MAG: ATP-grasp domain-containing protein [Chromatiaceae bacterium]|nr:ATP-grasp domain-containing protein [Chromatiaceae bacterium]MCF7996778.1 ATP-grasp domain-containing protein [Chromatiaceae bacterium]MCF8016972.1 ATP-grasp domain-containing protein [Chromatiaceae bacterium]